MAMHRQKHKPRRDRNPGCGGVGRSRIKAAKVGEDTQKDMQYLPQQFGRVQLQLCDGQLVDCARALFFLQAALQLGELGPRHARVRCKLQQLGVQRAATIDLAQLMMRTNQKRVRKLFDQIKTSNKIVFS